MKRMWAIATKEFLHILRDKRSLAFAIFMPMMMVILYGYAIDMELKHLRVGILDYDHSTESTDFIKRMTSGDFIRVAGILNSPNEVEPAFRATKYHAVLVIPSGYGSDLLRERTIPVQVLIDGADATTAGVVDNYLQAVVAQVNLDLLRQNLGDRKPPVEARPRVLYNPELISAQFIVPGLVAVILMMICAMLTSIAITREKETGTLEQILTTPVRSSQVILGKVLPYLLIASLDAILVLTVGRYLFGVKMAGSWWVLAGYSLIYLTIALSLGLLISAIAKTQQVAMSFAQLITVLPTIMLAGFIYPVASMPLPLQFVSHIIPAHYYLKVIRGIMLKGESWFPFDMGVMLLMAVILLTLASKRFRMRLDS